MTNSICRRKPTSKKHKTWDGDGILEVYDGYARLYDVSGRDMGKTPWSTPLLPGSTLSVGSKDIEVDSIVTKDSFMGGRRFPSATPEQPSPFSTQRLAPQATVKLKVERPASHETKYDRVVAPKSKATTAQFKTPLLSTTILPRDTSGGPQARHDPNGPGALVMRRPDTVPRGKQVVDVVVDPFLCKHLRDHQREGVKFMYECVMGMRSFNGEGAILADEMGLGKTLQTIALLWTLLKQNPVYEDPPVIKKALVVCPATLVSNWRREFRKWLGLERIGVFVVDGAKTRLSDFTMGKAYSVMIVGYEKLRSIQEDLKKGPGIDIIIADEGHRLKTAQNKSALAIKSLNTRRRIILSGTPIQNDLSEFYVMVDFVNPGLLGKYSAFRKEFENPIIKSRQPGASEKDVEKGEAQSAELASLTALFILRRTISLLAKYLPPKTEFVLFCRPTKVQAAVYRSVLSSPLFGAILRNSEASLQLINVLKKVCNSPSLLRSKVSADEQNSTLCSLLSQIPSSLINNPGASGKLQVLDSLLHQIRTTTREKVVIASNYTSTLDILGNLLQSLSYSYLRLDGNTGTTKRQALVDRFNRSDANACFVFLLSARAGGTGLNLIGASRLILFDVDWNPSTDAQTMARIHRDGQNRPCRIYRLLTLGALDEKIYQRQLTKLGLADSIMEKKSTISSFSSEELRDLFSLDESDACKTHELLKCSCGGSGVIPSEEDEVASSDEDDLPSLQTLLKASEVDMEGQERKIKEHARRKTEKGKVLTLKQYAHLDTKRLADLDEGEAEMVLDDDVLRDVLRQDGNRISFVFSKTSS
jgi:DNA repair and recombination protein RAD54B